MSSYAVCQDLLSLYEDATKNYYTSSKILEEINYIIKKHSTVIEGPKKPYIYPYDPIWYKPNQPPPYHKF